MLARRDKEGLPIELIKVDARRLITFILVDGKYLVWVINELEDERNRMHGIFIIEDPRREITSHFIKLLVG
jgi:hypothetical protein